MHHPKSLLATLFASLLTASLPAMAFGATDLTREWTAPTRTYDCSGKAAAWLLRGAFSIQLADISTLPAGSDDLPELYGKAACKAAYSAWALTGYKQNWMKDLRFVLADSAAGSDYQAFHAGISDHMVVATRQAVAKLGRTSFDELPLVWTLGHELGHGVRRDEAVQYGLIGVGSTMLVGGIYVAGILGRVGVGIPVALTGLALATCGKGLYEMKAEVDADEFGFRVLSRAGVGNARAKEVVLATMMATKDDPSNPCVLRATTAHPSIEYRMRNIRSIPDAFHSSADEGAAVHHGLTSSPN